MHNKLIVVYFTNEILRNANNIHKFPCGIILSPVASNKINNPDEAWILLCLLMRENQWYKDSL